MRPFAIHPPTLNSRRGALLLELALVSPVFLLLVSGAVEFGQALRVSQAFAAAARHGAECGVQRDSTNDDVHAAIEHSLSAYFQPTASAADIAIAVKPVAGRSQPQQDVSNARSKDLVQVSVSAPFERVALAGATFLQGTVLRGDCALRRE
jgi:Flp pilus assembly protein TadG